MDELVSIIMPCHNGEIYLEESINSVIAQTMRSWELLVIDDNSSDNSLEIIKKYCEKDSRIKLFRTNISSGLPSVPRNIGIQNALGRYIAFLDCDDAWIFSKLENQLKLFSDDTAIVYSDYKKMDQNGLIRNKIIHAPKLVSYKRLLDGNCIGNLTGMYDTEKVGKILQKNIHHEDYVMWLEILKKGYIGKNTGSVEAIYRENYESISGNKLKSLVWTWNIYRHILQMNWFISIWHFIKYAINGLIKFSK